MYDSSNKDLSNAGPAILGREPLVLGEQRKQMAREASTRFEQARPNLLD